MKFWNIFLVLGLMMVVGVEGAGRLSRGFRALRGRRGYSTERPSNVSKTERAAKRAAELEERIALERTARNEAHNFFKEKDLLLQRSKKAKPWNPLTGKRPIENVFPLTQEARVGLASAAALTGAVGAITAGEIYLNNRANNNVAPDLKPAIAQAPVVHNPQVVPNGIAPVGENLSQAAVVEEFQNVQQDLSRVQQQAVDETKKLQREFEEAQRISNEARRAFNEAVNGYGIDTDQYAQLENQAEQANSIVLEKYLNYLQSVKAVHGNAEMMLKIERQINEIKNPGITKRLSRRLGLSAKMYGVKRFRRKFPTYVVDQTTGMWKKVKGRMPNIHMHDMMPKNVVNAYHTVVDPVTEAVSSGYNRVFELAGQARDGMYNLGNGAYNKVAQGLNYITPQMLRGRGLYRKAGEDTAEAIRQARQAGKEEEVAAAERQTREAERQTREAEAAREAEAEEEEANVDQHLLRTSLL